MYTLIYSELLVNRWLGLDKAGKRANLSFNVLIMR
jgi:hypothetical protein